jgi:hypothetical protein
MFSTPILFLIFNRPQTTEKVFEKIRKQKPKRLFIAADGPRKNNQADVELCKITRNIVSKIDWECEVKTLFREENLGCGLAPAEAITWFFENVEQGIILEDDIDTDPSFFTFCEELLNYYKNDEQIMHISGSYFFTDLKPKDTTNSYYFSKQIHGWGWATWRRAWKFYDYDMKDWSSSNTDAQLKSYYGDHYPFWKNIFSNMQFKGNDIWDYQWIFAVYKQNGIAINPTANLTKNIGFDTNATHTTNPNSNYAKVKLDSILHISHQSNRDINTENDTLYYKHYLGFDWRAELEKQKLSWKLKNNLKRLRRKLLSFLR